LGCFKSQALEPDTKERFESYFGKKIFVKEPQRKAVAQTKGSEGSESGPTLRSLAEGNKVLFEANRTLADANKKLADAHLILAEGNRDLIKILKEYFEKGLDLSSYTHTGPTPAREEENVGQGNLYEDFAQGKTRKAGKR
jgi:hypothetical protein